MARAQRYAPATRADLKRSSIPDRIAKQCGIEDVVGGFGPQRYRLNYYGIDGRPLGFYRERNTCDPLPLDALGKQQRYTQPPGLKPRFYLPRLLNWRKIANDPTVTIYITEGEKKSIRACMEGLACIGLGGVWNWRSNRTPIADLNLFAWRGRRVVIVFDSDAADNRNIQLAEFLLSTELEKRGARVTIKRLRAS